MRRSNFSDLNKDQRLQKDSGLQAEIMQNKTQDKSDSLPSKSPKEVKRMILKNFKSAKSLNPQVIQIDAKTKEAKLLTPFQRKSL